METVGYILALITFLWLWDTKLREKIFFSKQKEYEIIKEYRIKLLRVIDQSIIGELLNCATCLSFWIGLTAFFITNDLFFLSLPIHYKLLAKML